MPQNNPEDPLTYVVRDAADQYCDNGFRTGIRIISDYKSFVRFFSGDTSNLLSCMIDRLVKQGDVERLKEELKKFESYMEMLHQCVRSSVEEEKNRLETQNNLSDQPRWQEIPELHDQFLGKFQIQYTQLNTKELPQDLQDFNDWIVNWSKELEEEHGELVRENFVFEAWKKLVELTWLCNYSTPTCSLFMPDKANKIQLVEKQGNINKELLNVYIAKTLKDLVKEKKIDEEYETTALIPSLYDNEDNDNFDCPNIRSRKQVSGVSWSIELVLIAEDLITPEMVTRAQPVSAPESTLDHVVFSRTQANSAVDEIDLVQTSQQAMRFTADESEKPAIIDTVLSGTQPGAALEANQREDVENLIVPEFTTEHADSPLAQVISIGLNENIQQERLFQPPPPAVNRSTQFKAALALKQ